MGFVKSVTNKVCGTKTADVRADAESEGQRQGMQPMSSNNYEVLAKKSEARASMDQQRLNQLKNERQAELSNASLVTMPK